jgi:hypothetical protein
MLDEEQTRPKEINVVVATRNFLHRLFKARYDATLDAEDLKEFIPEGLLLRALALNADPFARKLDRVIANFVPCKGHSSNRV